MKINFQQDCPVRSIENTISTVGLPRPRRSKDGKTNKNKEKLGKLREREGEVGAKVTTVTVCSDE